MTSLSAGCLFTAVLPVSPLCSSLHKACVAIPPPVPYITLHPSTNMDWFSDCWSRYQAPMSLMEEIRLSPFQKWSKHRRPPMKFFLHVALIALTTAHVLFLTNTLSPYLRSASATWTDLLAPDGAPFDSVGPVSTFYLYDVEALRASLNQTVNTYFVALNKTLDYYSFRFESVSSVPPPLRMTIVRYAAGEQIFDGNTPYSSALVTETFDLVRVGDIGPFTLSSSPSLVHSIYSLSVEFSVLNFDIVQNSRQCYRWTVTVRPLRSAFSHHLSLRNPFNLNFKFTTVLTPHKYRQYCSSKPDRIQLPGAIPHVIANRRRGGEMHCRHH